MPNVRPPTIDEPYLIGILVSSQGFGPGLLDREYPGRPRRHSCTYIKRCQTQVCFLLSPVPVLLQLSTSTKTTGTDSFLDCHERAVVGGVTKCLASRGRPWFSTRRIGTSACASCY